jgi:hypothetical protein
MTAGSNTAALITVVIFASAVAWVDRRCLADLARTNDRELRHLDRSTWALVILLSFPIGPALYLRYGKGPGRYT